VYVAPITAQDRPVTVRDRKVAIVHYWLVGMRGGERVVEQLLDLFPEADIYTHVYVPEAVSERLNRQRIRTTFIQKIPGARKHYKKLLPLMPMALNHLDLGGYDLVISSESGPAKGVMVAPAAQHICYCHSPMRYLWDHYHLYWRNADFASRMMMPLIAPALRQWDFQTAQGIDEIVANSSFVQKRIRRTWGRESTIVPPPIATEAFSASETVDDYYLWVGELIAYKRPDLAVDAFTRLGLPLVVVGDGEMSRMLHARAGPNIRFVPRMKFDALKRAYARCRALVFTAEEDFGMVPVEANASGRPVIAFGSGGVLDSIVPGVTGAFFSEQSVDALIEAVTAFDAGAFDPDACMRNAERFSVRHFRARIGALVRV